jgi:hypothetical protein
VPGSGRAPTGPDAEIEADVEAFLMAENGAPLPGQANPKRVRPPPLTIAARQQTPQGFASSPERSRVSSPTAAQKHS